MPDDAPSQTPADEPPAAARPRRAARAVEALGPARRGRARPGPPLLRAPPAHEERPLGSLRAERRRPVAPHRAQPLPRGQPRARGRRQLAPAPERPRPPAAAVLVDRARLQALRPARVGRAAAARALGPARRPRDVRLRRAPLRPAHGRVRRGRALDDAALLRAGALDARRRLHDGGPRDGVRRPRGRGVRPRRARGRRPSAARCRGW